MQARFTTAAARAGRTAAVCLLAALPATAAAQEAAAPEAAEETGWSDTAELTLVATDGNAETSTVGFQNTLVRRAERSVLTIRADGLRAETTRVTRTAVGLSPADFVVREERRSERSAESYHLRGRFDRKLGERLFWSAGAGWQRNEFAGIANRYTAFGAVGHIWFERDGTRLQTDYGLTYTEQEDVVDDPRVSDGYFGVRLGWDYLRALTATTTFTSELVLDANLDDTSDLRADAVQAVAVSISEKLALKVSLELLWDNLPGLEALPLVGPDGTAAGDTVRVELESLDTRLSVALVVGF